jgi:hypothetical protein
MAPTPPDDALRNALRRLDEHGVRADQFLNSVARQLISDQPLAAQHAAYALREALMSIVKLGRAPTRNQGSRRRCRTPPGKGERRPKASTRASTALPTSSKDPGRTSVGWSRR